MICHVENNKQTTKMISRSRCTAELIYLMAKEMFGLSFFFIFITIFIVRILLAYVIDSHVLLGNLVYSLVGRGV